MKDKRIAVNGEVEEETRAALGDRVFETTIRTSAILKNGEPVFDFNASSNGAKDYSALAREIQKTFQPPVKAARPRTRSAK
jgi:chromosome partitioning protein